MKALIIRPTLPADYYIKKFTNPAAKLVKNKARTEGWRVKELVGNKASEVNVTDQLTKRRIDFVIHYDHGDLDVMGGQNNNKIEPVIYNGGVNNNVTLLSGKTASSVSCSNARGLGPEAIHKGAIAYLGYDDDHWVVYKFIDKFIAAANAANYALLEGKTFQEAYQIGYDAYDNGAQQIPTSDEGDLVAGLMEWDRDHLKLLGDPNARVKP
jgi:hypothetical protein